MRPRPREGLRLQATAVIHLVPAVVVDLPVVVLNFIRLCAVRIHLYPRRTMPSGIPCRGGYFAGGTSCRVSWHVRCAQKCKRPIAVPYHRRSSGRSAPLRSVTYCPLPCWFVLFVSLSSLFVCPPCLFVLFLVCLFSLFVCPPCLFVLLVCLLHADAPWSLAPRGERTNPTCTRRSTHSSISRPSERQGCERQAGKIPHRHVSRTSVRCCSVQPTWLRLRSRQRSARPFAAGRRGIPGRGIAS